MPLQLEIVTPEARVYEATIDSVVLPTTTGEIGILPGHIPLVTELEAGELQVQKSGGVELLAVGHGFAQIEGDRVSVLAESAITEEAIDENAVEQAMERAAKALQDATDLDPAEIERLEALVRFASAQLLLKKRKKG
ncbi:MAG: ATP synthase F1 subunit epsilon [Puniceicoccaceae bacterium]|nr:MAG: ATP synthase F1 subunit epsilon [Puniceicoccaceae bacterium]